ncbi:MAG: hypothetical protein JNL61_20000, partial [Rhizobiaceae bacterium]|nr:hypothetical protein [Rhizobiaceae bacterium]
MKPFCKMLPAAAMLTALAPVSIHAGDADFYPKRVWGGFNGGELNTSLLVFNDVNRNGRYDLADRSLQFIAVELDRPNGRSIIERTNSGGFANFKMSVALRDRPVVDPGRYSMRVLPPPGWSVTTGNIRQESDYVITPGAPGDMKALRTTHPVGLAQNLSISGQARAGAKVRATGPDGAAVDVAMASDGRFRFEAASGEWSIAITDADGRAERRSVHVDHAPVTMSAQAVDDAAAPQPLPVQRIVTFDDLMQAPQVREVPSGYGALDWYNFVAMHQYFTGGPGYLNTVSSGEFIAYNSSGHP